MSDFDMNSAFAVALVEYVRAKADVSADPWSPRFVDQQRRWLMHPPQPLAREVADAVLVLARMESPWTKSP